MIYKILYMLLALSMVSCTDYVDENHGTKIDVGDMLPAFSVRTADGVLVTRDSLKGSRSVIVFFNTSCVDCQNELPIMDSLYRKYCSSDDFRMICIARDEEKKTIGQFWETKDLVMPYSPQKGSEVYNLFAWSVIPRIYMSDTDGVVSKIYGDKAMPSFTRLCSDIEYLNKNDKE